MKKNTTEVKKASFYYYVIDTDILISEFAVKIYEDQEGVKHVLRTLAS